MRGAARGRRSIGAIAHELPLDAIQVVNNAGVFSHLYDAWAAVRNLEWMLPGTAGSDAHDVWYLGSAVTRFPGRDGLSLPSVVAAGTTRAHVGPGRGHMRPTAPPAAPRDVLRFLFLCRLRMGVGTVR